MVDGDHQFTASDVLTSSLRNVHFASHARTNMDNDGSKIVIVIVICLLELHALSSSMSAYSKVAFTSLAVSVKSHGGTYDAVVDPLNAIAVTPISPPDAQYVADAPSAVLSAS
jgi:hypothetical protein